MNLHGSNYELQQTLAVQSHPFDATLNRQKKVSRLYPLFYATLHTN